MSSGVRSMGGEISTFGSPGGESVAVFGPASFPPGRPVGLRCDGCWRCRGRLRFRRDSSWLMWAPDHTTVRKKIRRPKRRPS